MLHQPAITRATMTAKLLSWAATAAAFGILLQPYAGSSATSREGQPWQSVEEETLGLEGQDHGERTRCMRDKQPQPHGLLKSHLGKRFPSELKVDDLFSRGPLKGAECEREQGCGILTLKPQPQGGKPCVREVPKLAHFVWLDHALPKKYAANIARFMEVNSDWPVMLWVNGAAKDVSTLTNILGSKRFLPDPEAAIKRLHLKSIDAYKSRFRNWDIIQNQSNVGARSDWIRLEVRRRIHGHRRASQARFQRVRRGLSLAFRILQQPGGLRKPLQLRLERREAVALSQDEL